MYFAKQNDYTEVVKLLETWIGAEGAARVKLVINFVLHVTPFLPKSYFSSLADVSVAGEKRYKCLQLAENR